MFYKLSVLLVLALIVTGCASKTVPLSTADKEALKTQAYAKPEMMAQGKKPGTIEEETLARQQKERMKLEAEAKKRALLADIHFDYDSYKLTAEDIPRLHQIAQWLDNNRNITLTVEGHCDDRGTVEYNLALGQKRAEMVKEYLVSLGISQTRVKTISYGKELPLNPDRTEEARAQNRRAHFKEE